MRKIIFILLFLMFVTICCGRCVAHYKMNDDANNTVVVDSQGYSNGTFADATGDPNTDAHTTTGNLSGVVITALSFDGTDDYIDTGNSFQSVFQKGFTISLWLKPGDGQPPYNTIFFGNFYIDTTDSGGFEVFLLTTGKVNVWYFTRAEVPGKVELLASVFGDGIQSWTMVCVTLQQVGDKIKGCLYIGDNLVDISEETLSMSDFNVHGITPYIGATHESLYGSETKSGYFNGLIDNVMIFDHALSQAEIRRLYNDGNGTENLSEIDSTTRPRRSNNSPLPSRARYE